MEGAGLAGPGREPAHHRDNEIAAARGGILDRDGTPLAVSRETYKVSVAPGELKDRDAAIAVLRSSLGLSARKARQLTAPNRKWSVVPGRYPPTVREALAERAGRLPGPGDGALQPPR